jgi:hypothetical protein
MHPHQSYLYGPNKSLCSSLFASCPVYHEASFLEEMDFVVWFLEAFCGSTFYVVSCKHVDGVLSCSSSMLFWTIGRDFNVQNVFSLQCINPSLNLNPAFSKLHCWVCDVQFFFFFDSAGNIRNVLCITYGYKSPKLAFSIKNLVNCWSCLLRETESILFTERKPEPANINPNTTAPKQTQRIVEMFEYKLMYGVFWLFSWEQ